MEIITYNRQSLLELINSPQFAALPNIPVSRHRALSQIANPRAADDDVLLVVQYDKGRVIGYLGVLPDYVFFGNSPVKSGWLSCFWVDVRYRSQQVAAGLFLQVMEAWENRIMITNFVPVLAPLYLKTGLFSSGLTKTGYRAYMRSNMAEIFPPKAEWLKQVKPFLRAADVMINLCCDIRFALFKGFKVTAIRWNYANEIDEQSARFIEKFQEKNWNRRGKTELQWILDHPWIIERSMPDLDSKRYYFSSVSKRFTYRIIRLYSDSGNINGWALICLRDNAMTVPYVFVEDGYHDFICRILINIMIEFKLSMVTTFHDQMTRALRKFRLPFIFTKPILKPYLISKKLDFIREMNFQDGDGDCVFY